MVCTTHRPVTRDRLCPARVDVGHHDTTGAADEVHHERGLFIWEAASEHGVMRRRLAGRA
jgi:hypothetical protein